VRRVPERKLEDRDLAEDSEALDFEMSEER